MSVSCRVTNWAWGDSVMAGSVYSVGRGYAPDASHAWVKYQVGCGAHGRPGCRGCRGRSPDLRDGSIGVSSGGYKQVVGRSEEHTSELQSLMRPSYAVFCLKKKKEHKTNNKPKQY